MNKYCNYINHPITKQTMSTDISVKPEFTYITKIKELDSFGEEVETEYQSIYYNAAVYEIVGTNSVIKYASALNYRPKKIFSDVPIEPNLIIAKDYTEVKANVNINGKLNTNWNFYVNGMIFISFNNIFSNPNIYPLGTTINSPTESQLLWCQENFSNWISNGKIIIPSPQDRIFYNVGKFSDINSTVGSHSHSISFPHSHNTIFFNHTHAYLNNTVRTWRQEKSGGRRNEQRGNSLGYSGANGNTNSFLKINFSEINPHTSTVNLPNRRKYKIGVFLK